MVEWLSDIGKELSAIVILITDIIALCLFLIYGNLLQSMLRESTANQTPYQISIRTKKRREVLWITVIASFCFILKVFIELFSLITRQY